MTFIIRWPAILALLALVVICLGSAFVATVILADLPVDLGAALAPSDIEAAQGATWIQAGLMYAGGLFFLIAAVRLMRRTQGFWTWLLGFACFGGSWALAQQSQGDLLAKLQSADLDAFAQPQRLLDNPMSTEAQLGVLAIILIIGLIIFVVDAADRSYWDKQAG